MSCHLLLNLLHELANMILCEALPSIIVSVVEAIVLTARRNTMVISPYCVISLVKIFIFIEWALFHSRSLCYVINK